MSKYYIASGTLQLIYSTNKTPIEAACAAIWETNDNDELDRFMTVDERGFRTKKTADELTAVFSVDNIMEQSGWNKE